MKLTSYLVEEILLDFREMVGAHSGENMSEAMWSTLVEYGIEEKASIIYVSLIAIYAD